MIPTLIEPSRLSFDIVKPSLHITTQSDEIKLFRDFVQELNVFFEDLKKNEIGIAVTKELSDLYKASIPANVYEGTHSIYRLAREVYIQKFSKLAVVVHAFGDHSQNIEFDEKYIDIALNLHNTETYFHWMDMSFLAYHHKLIPFVIKSQKLSIFNKDFFVLNDENKKFLLKINVLENIEKFLETEHFRMLQLTKVFSSFNKDITEIPCKGTGTHSSMWGQSISRIDDVPREERYLLTRLLETGAVKSILFLSFEKKYQPSPEPLIEIEVIEKMENSDILICTLKGQGRKQNAQTIKIEMEKGTGELLSLAFNKQISIDKMDIINRMIAASKEA